MAVSSNNSGQRVWQRRDRNTQLKIWAMWLAGTASIHVELARRYPPPRPGRFFWDAPRIAADIGGRAVPPRWAYIGQTVGTALGHP